MKLSLQSMPVGERLTYASIKENKEQAVASSLSTAATSRDFAFEGPQRQDHII
jgi:hypothetical protein